MEVCGKIAGVEGPYNGRYAFERFRTDVGWGEQLQASKNLLLKIRPILSDLGLRIDLENHEDLTSQELIRMIEEIGPEYLGVSLDVANLPVLGEDPYEGSVRMAPSTHLVHVKDIFLIPTIKGLLRQIRPAGEGIINWESIIPMIYKQDPNTRLLVEDHKGLIQIDLLEPNWRKYFPELAQHEVDALMELAKIGYQKVEQGTIEAPESYEAIPYKDQKFTRITKSLAYLQEIRNKYGLWDQ
jgi:sugar phosphate isomerase/epimerase